MKSNFGNRGIAFTCSLIALSFSQAAMAAGEAEEAIEDETIVVSATRTPVEIEDAPATVTVIDGKGASDRVTFWVD